MRRSRLSGKSLGMADRPKPQCTVVPDSQRYSTIALRSLRFDETDLTVEVQGSGFAFARVIFRDPAGFRVLDERDLCEFWPDYSEPRGWLWEVHRGGWMDLERQRPLFNSHEVLAPLREFFVVANKCINVFCRDRPEIVDRGADPQHA